MSLHPEIDAEHSPPKRQRRSSPASRRAPRKTTEFSVTSEFHQQQVLAALKAALAAEPLRRKRSSLSWMIRRLAATLEVHKSKRDARQ